jgi:hypothetical protein
MSVISATPTHILENHELVPPNPYLEIHDPHITHRQVSVRPGLIYTNTIYHHTTKSSNWI